MHIHVIKPGAWEIRVAFMECTEAHLVHSIKWRRTEPTAKELNQILSEVVKHRPELKEEWEKKVVPPLVPLKPKKKGA